jgi:hypothetical protein
VIAGDRVKLTDYAAKGLNSRATHGLDWGAREGTVRFMGRTGVSVLWDGRKSLDAHPRHALELVEDG